MIVLWLPLKRLKFCPFRYKMALSTTIYLHSHILIDGIENSTIIIIIAVILFTLATKKKTQYYTSRDYESLQETIALSKSTVSIFKS